MPAPADELADLRTALCRGTWRRLLDPRLELVLLERPDVWAQVVVRCSHELIVDSFADDASAVEMVAAWVRESGVVGAARVENVLRRQPSHIRSAILYTAARMRPDEHQREACLRLARLAVSARPSLAREAALAVLSRWPT